MKTVKIPTQLKPLFKKAKKEVEDYFSQLKRDPSKGTIEIAGERYILVRAASMSVDFFETLIALYGGKSEGYDVAWQLLFDLAHTIGKQDAKRFKEKMELTDPMESLSAGPMHFAYSGWASVEISPKSNLSPDENIFLLYDHPYSFESSEWIKQKKNR